MARLPALSALLLSSLLSAVSAQFCTPDEACWPSKARVETWLRTLSSEAEVYTPYGEEYYLYLSKAADQNNRLKTDFPGLIIHPATQQDVTRVVRWAAQNKIRVVAKCSGHDYNGRSTARGAIQLVMTKFKGMQYNEEDETLALETGTDWSDLYTYVHQFGRAIVGGQFRSVCAAGCLSGGCHGPLSRQYGLGIDNVVGIRIALYNGTVLDLAGDGPHADLFNALLGAGSSTFGVILGFVVKTHPAPPAVLTMQFSLSLLPPGFQAGDELLPNNALSAFYYNLTWIEALPNTLAGYLTVSNYVANMLFVYTGSDPAEAQAVLQPLMESKYYIADSATPGNFSSLAEFSESTSDDGVVGLYKRQVATSAFFEPDQATLDLLAQVVIATPQVPFSGLYTFGGATKTGTAGVVPHSMRNGPFEFAASTAWEDPKLDGTIVGAFAQLYPLIANLPSSSSYINEVTLWGPYGFPDWKTRFYSKYDDVLAVKKRYDPCNLYSVAYGVGSDLPKAICRLKA